MNRAAAGIRSLTIFVLLTSLQLIQCAPFYEQWHRPPPVLLDLPDQALANMARHLPGYGGHFRDEQGSLQVYLTQAAYVRSQELPVAMREKFKASMLTVYGADYSAGASFLPNGKPAFSSNAIEFLAGDYTTIELANWYKSVRSLLSEPGVVFTDLDEAANRLTLGIESEQVRASIQAQLTSKKIPIEAVNFVISEPFTGLASLKDDIRPVLGGTMIGFAKSTTISGVANCTMGVNALDPVSGKIGFVTNSHCSERQGGVDAGEYWQFDLPLNSIFPMTEDPIGLETIDPPFTYNLNLQQCLPFRRCRFSDANFVTYYDSVNAELGKLARPQLINGLGYANNGEIDDTGEQLLLHAMQPTMPIVGETDQLSIGDYVHKIGATTGWTYGTLARKCIWINMRNSDITLACQDEVYRTNPDYVIAEGGDSGSPVFIYPTASTAILVGILWGSKLNTDDQYVYSPIRSIKKELGALQFY